MYFVGSNQPLSVPNKYKCIKKAFHAVRRILKWMGPFVWTYVLLWNWPETLFKQGQLSFRQEKHKPISLSVFVLWLRSFLLVYSPREWGLLTKVWQMSVCSTAGSKAAGMSPPGVQVPLKLHPWTWNSALFRTKTVVGVIAVFQDSYKVYRVAVKYQ